MAGEKRCQARPLAITEQDQSPGLNIKGVVEKLLDCKFCWILSALQRNERAIFFSSRKQINLLYLYKIIL